MVAEEVFTVFLISPPNLGGQRAKLVFNPEADFEVARRLRLRSIEGAPLGEVFAFVRWRGSWPLAFTTTMTSTGWPPYAL